MTNQGEQGDRSRPSTEPFTAGRPAAEQTSYGATRPASDFGTASCPDDSEMVDQARSQARHVAAEVKQQTAEVTDQAKQHVTTLLTDQKQRAAERLGTFAGTLRDAAQKLGSDDIGSRVGHYAYRAADQVDSMSSYVRRAELQTFVRDAGQFARRRPEVFIGGAFLAGLIAARFLKASGRNASGHTASQPDDTATGGW